MPTPGRPQPDPRGQDPPDLLGHADRLGRTACRRWTRLARRPGAPGRSITLDMAPSSAPSHADELEAPARAGRRRRHEHATFIYKALDRAGAPTTRRDRRRLEGGRRGAAAPARPHGHRRRREERRPRRVEELLDRYRGLKARDVTVMARQLATMISSGLSLLRALYVLEEQTEASKPEARDHRGAPGRRGRAWRCRRRWPSTRASSTTCSSSMVRAGESGGNLEEVLERVAIQLEKDDNLRRTVKLGDGLPDPDRRSSPSLMLIAMVLFIIPVFANMFTDLGGKLPALTQFMITASDAMRSYWYLVLLGAVRDRLRLPQVEAHRLGRIHVGHDQAALPHADRGHRAQDRRRPLRPHARHPDGLRRADPAGARHHRPDRGQPGHLRPDGRGRRARARGRAPRRPRSRAPASSP